MKKILLLGAGLEQVLAIREAKRLGYFVVACDANPDAQGFAEADARFVADIQDMAAVEKIASDCAVDGIFTHAVEIPHVVASVAERLGLPGLSPEVAIRATNKKLRIAHLKENGIPCADFVAVNAEDRLAAAAEEQGFPLIIKPVDNAGSRGVRVVSDSAELLAAYRQAIQYSKSKEVLLEKRMSGPEISTESVVYGGKIITFAFADRNYQNPELFFPYFVENGINFPSVLPAETQSAVIELVEKTIRILRIDFGAAKGDVIIDGGIPKVIEMASRTSGGWFGAGSIPAATGVNMLKPLLQMAVGDEPDLDALRPTRWLGCAQRYVIPVKSGRVRAISGVEEAQNMPGVAMSTMFLPQIGSVIRKSTNHAERYGQIICTGDSRDEAIRRCEDAIAKIKVEVDEQ